MIITKILTKEELKVYIAEWYKQYKLNINSPISKEVLYSILDALADKIGTGGGGSGDITTENVRSITPLTIGGLIVNANTKLTTILNRIVEAYNLDAKIYTAIDPNNGSISKLVCTKSSSADIDFTKVDGLFTILIPKTCEISTLTLQVMPQDVQASSGIYGAANAVVINIINENSIRLNTINNIRIPVIHKVILPPMTTLADLSYSNAATMSLTNTALVGATVNSASVRVSNLGGINPHCFLNITNI
jgi:hypothetical protein